MEPIKPSDPPHELEAYKQYCKDLRKGWTQMYKRLLEKDEIINQLKNKNMKYEILIGEVWDLTLNTNKPANSIVISEEQKDIIEMFASTRKDMNLHTIYTMNGIEFKMFPFLLTSNDSQEGSESN